MKPQDEETLAFVTVVFLLWLLGLTGLYVFVAYVEVHLK